MLVLDSLKREKTNSASVSVGVSVQVCVCSTENVYLSSIQPNNWSTTKFTVLFLVANCNAIPQVLTGILYLMK